MALEKTNEGDIFVAKHTAAVHIDNKLTLLERKVFNILLKNSRHQDKSDMHMIHIKDLAELLDSKFATNYEYLKEVLHGLVKRSIRFNILNKDKKRKWESSISILSEVHYDGGTVYYKPSQSFIDIFIRPSSYAYLNIRYQTMLSSKHSLALWEYCCEQLDSSKSRQLITPYIELEKLKELLGIEGGVYEEYKIFNSKVLKKAIAEINKKTDISISSVLVRRSGAKISGLAFNISRLREVMLFDQRNDNANFQLDLMETDIITTINKSLELQDLEMEAREVGLVDDYLVQFLKNYDVHTMRQAIQAMKKSIDQGVVIKNIAGYLRTILDKGIIEVKSIEEELDAKNKQQLYEGIMKFKSLDEPMASFFSIFASRYENHFRNWISKMDFKSYQNGVIILSTHSPFFKDWVSNNLHSQIRECGTLADTGFRDFEIMLEDAEIS